MAPQPNSKKINDLAAAQAGAYAEQIDGKPIHDLLQEIIDAINELDAGNGSGSGDTITGATFDSASRTLVIATDENPSGVSVVIPTGSVSGGDGKLDGLTLDKGLLDVTLEASVSDGSTVSVSLEPLRNRIYPVADLAARNAIANPTQGSIAFIDDADGNGNPGISGFADPGWTTPTIITSGGGGGAGDGKLNALTLDKGLLDVTLEASVSDGSTVSVSLEPLRNRIYPVADLAARNAIANPTQGSIAFIDDADGNGNPGISGFADPGWTNPTIIMGGGSVGGGVQRYDAGNGVWVTASGPGATATVSGGVATISVPAGVELISARVNGETSDLDGANNFSVVVEHDNSVAYNTSIANMYPPTINVINTASQLGGGPTASLPFIQDEGSSPQPQIIAIDQGSITARLVNLNAFSNWSILLQF